MIEGLEDAEAEGLVVEGGVADGLEDAEAEGLVLEGGMENRVVVEPQLGNWI